MFKELLFTKKFRYLAAAFLAILPFEYLSITGIHLPYVVEVSAFLLILVIFGREIVVKGVRSLFALRFSNINLLMVVAIAGAFYLGELEEAAIIVILFSLGEFLEDFGIETSKSSLQSLVEKTPKTAELKSGGTKPIEEISVGTAIIVRNGGVVPLDCTIASGASLVDESAITGEPLPKTKVEGDLVFAGSVVREGYLELTVTKSAKDSTLQKILDLTFTAASRKSKSQLFIQKFASIYTPSVLAVSILLVLIPVFVFGQPFDPWLVQALTLLIISCPCALVISTPVSVFSAVGNASKRGVVIKGGRFLEELGKIRAIAFDKTRTITKGEPIVTDVIPFGHATEEEVLGCLAGLETFSEHPISKSVIEYAKQKGIALHPHSDFTASLGKGVKGTCTVCAETHRCAGTLQYVTEEHGPVGKEIIEKAEALTRQGKAAIYVSSGEHIEGIVAVSDSIKAESADTVQQLEKLGVIPYMLTGDSKEPAQFVADKVGITHVFSSLLPQDKTERIREMKKQYGSVGMVGDGVNDAPSLALSDVGIAMGAAGSDVAIENADIAIMNDKLSFLPGLISLSRRMNGIIRFNVSLAVVTKLAFLGFAVAGYSSIIGAIVADVGVSVFVILNSLRLFENQKN